MRNAEVLETLKLVDYHTPVFVYGNTGGPGVPDYMSTIEGLVSPDFVLVANCDAPKCLSAGELVDLLENIHECADVMVAMMDCGLTYNEAIVNILNIYVDSDGPTDYGSDDAFTQVVITIDV